MLPRNGIPTKTNKWILAVLFSILITETTQQQLNRVDVNPAVKLTREGESITILCILPQRTRYCRIAVPGEPIRVLEPGDNVDGIEYFGEGLDRGQCGARIQRVQAKHHGEFKCFMNIGTEELVGTSQVIVGKAPQEVTLQVNPSAPSHQLNQEFFAQCTASNSRPVANLTWFLGGEPITNGVHPPQVTENADSSTIVQMFERKLRAEDDGATLVCRAEHFANDRGTQEASYQFRIQFPPQPLPNQKIEGLTLGRTGMLNVTFRANPRPTTQWQINHDSIKEGSQNGRFEATEPHNIGVGTWQVALIIADLNLEDTTQEYILKAANSEGATEYVVYIGSSDGESTAGFPIGWIILIVIICLIVVLSVVLVIVARRTGRWCFAERDAAVIPKPAETSDTESVEAAKKVKSEPKQSKLRKPNLTFHAIFKKPNKTPKPEGDQAASQPGEGHPQETNPRDSEETVVITDELPEKKGGRDIVYAELMLKPSEDSKTPVTKNSATEYAEIVYVNPTTGGGGGGGADKK